MADIEQACFLQDFSGEPPDHCSRLYYGAEFCFWRLPSSTDIVAAKTWAQARALAFTMVTPVLGEDERQRLGGVLKEVLPVLQPGDEVLISDWGALELVRNIREDLVVVVGRALSGQKRGPRILDMTLTPEQHDYFQRGSWHNCEAVKLLSEQGIGRVEQDNLLQGVAPLPQGLRGSLHLPFAMVSSSRNCPFRRPEDTGPCPVHCGEIFSLKTNETDVLLYQDGNTQFLCNKVVPEDLLSLGIDRVVTHPEPGL